MEAELNGMEVVSKEIQWYISMLRELNIFLTLPITINVDNNASLAVARDLISNARTKYYRITQHYIKYLTVKGVAKWTKVPGTSLFVDMLTKPLPYSILREHRNQLIGFQGLLGSGENITTNYLGSEYSSNNKGDGPVGSSVYQARQETAICVEINKSEI